MQGTGPLDENKGEGAAAGAEEQKPRSLLLSLLWRGGALVFLLLFSFRMFEPWFSELDKALSRYEREERLPAVSLPRLSSEAEPLAPLSLLERTKSEAIVLHFWASWCSVCIAELPEIRALDEAISAPIVAVATFDGLSQLKASGKLVQMPYEHLWDEAGDLAQRLRIRSLPQTLVVGPEGKILLRIDRPLDKGRREAVIRALAGVKGEKADKAENALPRAEGPGSGENKGI